jgi:lysophospholipase L1-like esterase
MPTLLRNGQTILFIGDSITDCGRRDSNAPLGWGYVKLFSDLLAIREPARRVTIINKGISGNRVVDLADRWTDDCLRHRPDHLSIKIGINDLHCTLGNTPQAVPAEKFEEVYDRILERTREALPKCRILLIDPFYISADTAGPSFRNEVLKALPRYIQVVHEISRKHGTRLVRTHGMFRRLIRHHDPDLFCPEPVHPNMAGHLAIAEAVYQALSEG